MPQLDLPILHTQRMRRDVGRTDLILRVASVGERERGDFGRGRGGGVV